LDAVGGQGRSLFVARYIEGMELAGVAHMHGLSVSTTQRRLARVATRVDAMVRRDPALSELAQRGAAGRSKAETGEADQRQANERQTNGRQTNEQQADELDEGIFHE
jgi:hypothetical protein